eukprot:TRINITY_DN21684_c0_g1_i1.p1 TRINITY_DN21684_c0_g1~~TRINITY_DN21684_c0_g1_i1.p1  ORF type:complete len:234 (+),score=14.48 TRINITY_DN21684_c0_g1_i1:59-760(+)
METLIDRAHFVRSLFMITFSLVTCFFVSDDANLIMTVIMPMTLLRLSVVLSYFYWLFFAVLSPSGESIADRAVPCFLHFANSFLAFGVLLVFLLAYFSHHQLDDLIDSGVLIIAVLPIVELTILCFALLVSFFRRMEPAVAAVDFETRTWSAHDAVMYGNGQNTCVICLEEYAEGDLIGRAPCSHVFHEHCYRTWHSHKKVQEQLCPFRCEVQMNNSMTGDGHDLFQVFCEEV